MAIDANRAESLFVLEHWNYQQCPNATKFNANNCQRVAIDVGLVFLQIGNMYGLTGRNDAADRIVWARVVRLTTPILLKCRWHAKLKHEPRSAVYYLRQRSKVRITDAGRIDQNCLEDRV